LLADNLMPYALTNHMHEREVSAQLGVPVEFMPHVAPHFRGITMTVNLWLQQALTREQVQACYTQRYADEPLIEIVDEAPWVSRIAGRH
ncbi:MAG: N-acetyl-gamma-glutamyl-phosphate reductase, partial [Xanthomonas euvesicatoria]|nr:N-acetyl-gamma-glutamyl-phosphate reductase [Xanthomonas euvesicatoria]